MMRNHLVEPNMAIEPSPDELKYNRLVGARNALRAQVESGGIDSINDDQKALIVLVNVMETELDRRSRRIAGEKISERANSPKLSQRFLCAVWPPYLGVKPTDDWVRQKARKEVLSFYDSNLATLNGVKPQDYGKAAVLEGNLRVMKPLTLAKPKMET